MSSRIFTFLVFLFSLHVCAQDSFRKDSILIEERTSHLIEAEAIIDLKEVLLDSLSKNIPNPESDKVKDFLLYQSAKYYYLKGGLNNALAIVDKAIEDDYKDNSKDAKFYNLKGVILTLQKKFDSAIISYLNAVKGYQGSGNVIKEHVVYNNIANIYLALGDFEQSY